MDPLDRFRREPPLFLYKGFQVIIITDARGQYMVTINGQVLRAQDPHALRFKDYGYARDCAVKTIDRKVAERAGAAARKLLS